jgi:hypothetical protein
MKPIGNRRFVLTTPFGKSRVSFDEDGRGVLRFRTEAGSADPFERVEPFAPSPSELEAFTGVYRSDEMDTVFRITSKDGVLKLERTKTRPAALEPVVTDTFTSSAGALRFVRDANRRISGFTLEAGRVLGVKFWKDTRSRPSF